MHLTLIREITLCR